MRGNENQMVIKLGGGFRLHTPQALELLRLAGELFYFFYYFSHRFFMSAPLYIYKVNNERRMKWIVYRYRRC